MQRGVDEPHRVRSLPGMRPVRRGQRPDDFLSKHGNDPEVPSGTENRVSSPPMPRRRGDVQPAPTNRPRSGCCRLRHTGWEGTTGFL